MQASKNYELLCKRKINLHCHTLIFFIFIFFIFIFFTFTQKCLGLFEAFSWYPWFFFRIYPATHQWILKISRSRIFFWCNLVISKSLYLKNPAITNFSSSPFRAQDNGTWLYLKRLEISRINNYKFITSCYA